MGSYSNDYYRKNLKYSILKCDKNVSDCKPAAEIDELLRNVMFDIRLRYRDM